MSKDVVVIFKKEETGPVFMQRLIGYNLDEVLDSTKRKPPIPHEWILLEAGSSSENIIALFNAKYKDLQELDNLVKS